MAWQLIYTSAPRLFEAGRTGFGTVARHRAITPLLAAAVERVSQFARLPGFDSRRIIYSYRCIIAGAGQFHVFSCIRDAGSDYTGRTNHIAHHLIADAREVASVKDTGLNPADILLAMDWRAEWTEAPRTFEVADEIPLASMTPARTMAWQVLTGSADAARLPSGPAMQRGCYFVLPAGADARLLFSESSVWLGSQSWLATFTSSLQPNDDVADFRWIGVEANSPLRPNTDSAARPILDLTRPETLPAPPPLPAAALRPALPTPSHYGGLSPQVEQLSHAYPGYPAQDLETDEAEGASSLGDWSPEPVSPRKSKKWLGFGVAAAALIILSIGAASAFWFIRSKPGREPAAAAQQTPASRDWRHFHLPETEQWLAQHPDQRPAHENILREIWKTLTNPGSPTAFAGPTDDCDEFRTFLGHFRAWHAAWHQTAAGDWEGPVATMDALVKSDQAFEKLRPYLKPPHPQPPAPSDLLATAQRHRKAGTPPSAPPADWIALLKHLNAPAEDMASLEAGQGTAAAESPPKATPSVQPAMAALATAPPLTAAALPNAAPSADSLDAKHPIFFAFGLPGVAFRDVVEHLSIAIPPTDHLKVGAPGESEKQLAQWDLQRDQSFRPGKMAAEKITVENNKLSLSSYERPWRIVSRSDHDITCEFILVPLQQAPETNLLPLNLPFKIKQPAAGSRAIAEGKGRVHLERLRFGKAKPRYLLHPPGQRTPAYELKFENNQLLVASTNASPAPVLMTPAAPAQNANADRDRLKGLQRDLKALRPNERNFAENKAKLENEIADLQAKVAAAPQSPTAPTPPLAPPVLQVAYGSYSLLVILDSNPDQPLRLCNVTLEAPFSAIAPLPPSQ
ncbi:MAG TPA: hypothetical protein VD994_02550 [Prosthecobacter sp.]|nr:hypothetical protein [Prosthecobacter sp.]